MPQSHRGCANDNGDLQNLKNALKKLKEMVQDDEKKRLIIELESRKRVPQPE